VYLGIAVTISPILEVVLAPNEVHPVHRAAVVGVVLLAVSTQVTAIQRFVYLLGALDERAWHVGWLQRGRGSLTRKATVAFVASAVDLTVALTLLATISAPAATLCGNLVGAAVNFSLNRMWMFASRDARLPQLGRYAFVSVTSGLLNAGGVAVLLLLPGVRYQVAWVLVHLAVFVAWNFPLRQGYVFKETAGIAGDGV